MTTFAQPTTQVPRDRWGRPRVLPPGGDKLVPYRRCTSFIDVLDSRYNLELWKQRQVADGLARRPDLVLKAASANGDKDLLNEVCDTAFEAAGSSAASTTGTAVHKITEHIDRGEEPVVPPHAQADVDAYRHATKDLRVDLIEVFVVHDELQVGGTFDRVVEVDGIRYVADIKTGRIDYGASKIAMQLAIYSRSQHYNPHGGERRPLDVDTSRGLVVHLPAGSGECSLHWADLDAGWEGVRVAREVWEWRGRKGLLEAPAPEGKPDLFTFIDAAPDRPTLENLWRVNEANWTEDHTAAVKARLATIEDSSTASAA